MGIWAWVSTWAHTSMCAYMPVLSRYRSSTSFQKTCRDSVLLFNCNTATVGQRQSQCDGEDKRENNQGERDEGQQGGWWKVEKCRYERKGLEMDRRRRGKKEKKQEGAGACCLSPLLSDENGDLYPILSKVMAVTWEQSNLSDSHTCAL